MKGKRNQTLEERFWEKVESTEQNNCWPWKGAKNEHGYGVLYVPTNPTTKNRLHKAHRVSWYLRYKEWPSTFVLHRCDNPACVNPDHLRLGDHKDNGLDMVSRDRGYPKRKLTPEQVQYIRTSDRHFRDLAKEFGVSNHVIRTVYCGVAYRDHPDPRPDHQSKSKKRLLRKLTDEQVQKIRACPKNCPLPVTELATELGVSMGLIYSVYTRRTYRDLP